MRRSSCGCGELPGLELQRKVSRTLDFPPISRITFHPRDVNPTTAVLRTPLPTLVSFILERSPFWKTYRMSSRIPDRSGSQRSRSRSPSSWGQLQDRPRNERDNRDRQEPNRRWDNGNSRGSGPSRDMRDQVRLNQLQEDEQARAWVAQEDIFVLKQAKKKAEIRVKEGRAKPIDWLTVTLRVIDPTRDPLDDEIADSELDVVDPDGVFEGLSQSQLEDLEHDIDTFLKLESNPQNRDYWKVRVFSGIDF